jgi:membrane-associated protease RseP (regulator of RpoE activity)
MRMHLGPRAIALTLCLSLAAPAAFADNGPAVPPAATAPSSPPDPAAPAVAPEAPKIDEAALQARLDAAQQRLNAVQRREQAAQQREQAALQARLDAARRRMEVAAQQLAALSAQMYGPMMKRFQVLSGSPHALIGVQLERSSGTAGARVGEVSPGGPAQRAGIRSGDVIVAVNGADVRGSDAARRVIELLRGVKPGDKVHLRVRRDAGTRDLTVTTRPDWSGVYLARQFPDVPLPPVPPVPALAGLRGAPVIIGGPVADMELARLTPGLGRYFGTDSGVLVVHAPPDGALGLQDGDVILSIGGRNPIDSSHVIRILASYDPGEKIAMEVMRAHRKIALTTRMPAGSALSRRVLLMRRDARLGPGPVVRPRAEDRML